MKGRRKRDFLGRNILEKTYRWKGKRCGKAEGCRRDGELDEKGSPRSWEEMALGFVWRRLILPLSLWG